MPLREHAKSADKAETDKSEAQRKAPEPVAPRRMPYREGSEDRLHTKLCCLLDSGPDATTSSYLYGLGFRV